MEEEENQQSASDGDLQEKTLFSFDNLVERWIKRLKIIGRLDTYEKNQRKVCQGIKKVFCFFLQKDATTICQQETLLEEEDGKEENK